METRRQQIINLVNQQGEISFAALKEKFPDVSEVTLRKDLRYLDEEQLLIRVHGGAKSVQVAVPYLSDYYIRFAQNLEDKQIIAQKFARLLKPHDTFFLASGSTCGAVAKMLPNIPLRVFTDGLEVALNLAKAPNVEVNVLGGTVENDTMKIQGAGVLLELNKLRLDYAVCGTSYYSMQDGFGHYAAHSLQLSELLRQRADKMIIVMDSSKITPTRSGRFLPASNVDIVVSDGKLDPEVIANMESHGITVF